MDHAAQAPAWHIARMVGRLTAASTIIFLAWPATVAAQSAETAPPPEPGSMIVLREVPTRPAQATGTGDTLTVSMTPNDAFANALDIGLAELDDAQAALITSSALNRFNPVAQAGAANTAGALVTQTLGRDGLSVLDSSLESSAGSIVSGSVGSSLAAANTALDGALGSVATALGGLNGGGQ
ncbi:MAG: hypothetical protein WBA51_13720 [Erythrobacter sp.]